MMLMYTKVRKATPKEYDARYDKIGCTSPVRKTGTLHGYSAQRVFYHAPKTPLSTTTRTNRGRFSSPYTGYRRGYVGDLIGILVRFKPGPRPK